MTGGEFDGLAKAAEMFIKGLGEFRKRKIQNVLA